MSRTLKFLLLAGGLLAAGCRTFDDRHAVFPIRDNRDDHSADRFRDRYTLPTASGTNPCVPCAGGGGYSYPVGGLTGGTPISGGGYATPTVFPSGSSFGNPIYPSGPTYGVPSGPSLGNPIYPSGPSLGAPVYPGGDGVPVRPRRDDELPLPGEYSKPGAADMSRAPKPPSTLPVAGK